MGGLGFKSWLRLHPMFTWLKHLLCWHDFFEGRSADYDLTNDQDVVVETCTITEFHCTKCGFTRQFVHNRDRACRKSP